MSEISCLAHLPGDVPLPRSHNVRRSPFGVLQLVCSFRRDYCRWSRCDSAESLTSVFSRCLHNLSAMMRSTVSWLTAVLAVALCAAWPAAHLALLIVPQKLPPIVHQCVTAELKTWRMNVSTRCSSLVSHMRDCFLSFDWFVGQSERELHENPSSN